MLGQATKITTLLNAAVSGSGTASSALDVTQSGGTPLFLSVHARASGTNAMSIAVQHSANNSDWDAVPASALFNVATGAPFTFANVTTTASDQYCGVVTQQLKRYVRVNLTGTTLTQNVAVTAVTQHLNSDSI